MAKDIGAPDNALTQGRLPLPSEEAAAHSQQLQAEIRKAIDAANGMISFDRFMEMALYAPGLGYYAAGAQKIGEAGDFVTAPEISPLFSRCLARQCQQVLDEISHGDILEFGAGTGVMASDILLELEALGCLPGNYFILELSPDLRQRQQQTLQKKAPHLAERVCWLDNLPAAGFRGVILANEVVDAMPVHLVRFGENNETHEAYVAWEAPQGFVWREGPVSLPQLDQKIMLLRQSLDPETFCPGYVTEINLAQDAWVTSLAEMLEQGVILVIDYGFPQHEYYHPDRTRGTLMCHYRHHAHEDPLILVGLQDITAHVDFTSLANVAVAAGLDVMGFTGQGAFLLACGLDQLIGDVDPSDVHQYLQITQQVKKLTLPSEMGELFKVMAVGKDLPFYLNGFLLQDRRHRL